MYVNNFSSNCGNFLIKSVLLYFSFDILYTSKERRIAMDYSMEYVNGHIEVYDENGEFLFSADNKQEALSELAAAA